MKICATVMSRTKAVLAEICVHVVRICITDNGNQKRLPFLIAIVNDAIANFHFSLI